MLKLEWLDICNEKLRTTVFTFNDFTGLTRLALDLVLAIGTFKRYHDSEYNKDFLNVKCKI